MKGDHMLLSVRSRQMAIAAVMIALTVAATTLLRVPAFGSRLFFHFGEAVICTAALLGGRRMGATVGAVGSALADVVLGLMVWAPVSLLVHGFEGYVIGRMSDGRGARKDVVALAHGTGVMIAGYALGAWVIYGAAAVPIEVARDLAQGGAGAAIAWFVTSAITRACPALSIRGSGE
ncbi:MAG: ECF transporter S component [Firmicutes bacterium]|nr:ECF transporter S component [Bacillota bacterium]